MRKTELTLKILTLSKYNNVLLNLLTYTNMQYYSFTQYLNNYVQKSESDTPDLVWFTAF